MFCCSLLFGSSYDRRVVWKEAEVQGEKETANTYATEP